MINTKIRVIIIATLCAIGIMNVIEEYKQSREGLTGLERFMYENLRSQEYRVPTKKNVDDASLKGKYKIQDKEDECPVCFETKGVMKPFECIHSICENCFDGICKAHIEGNNITTELLGVRITEKLPINLVCPQCRAELRKPDNN